MKFGKIAAMAALATSLFAGAANAQADAQTRNKPEQIVTTSDGQFTICSAAGWYPTQCAGLDVPDPGDKQLSGSICNVIRTPQGTLVKTWPQWSEMGFVAALFEVDGQTFLATILNAGSMSTLWRYDKHTGGFDPVFRSGLMLSVSQPHQGVWDKSITRLELSYYSGGPRDGKYGGHVDYDSVSKSWIERRQ